MKIVQKFLGAVLFVSILSVPTFAGDMEIPGKTTPTPPPPSNSTTTTCETCEAAPASASDGTTSISGELLYETYRAMLGLY